MGAEVTVIPDFWYSKFHSSRVPPGNDQQLTEETVDSGYEIAAVSETVNKKFNDQKNLKLKGWKTSLINESLKS